MEVVNDGGSEEKASQRERKWRRRVKEGSREKLNVWLIREGCKERQREGEREREREGNVQVEKGSREIEKESEKEI